MNKIGSPIKKPEPIVEEPTEDIIEPITIEQEPELEQEEVKEPEKNKTVQEDVMKVVDVINGLKGERDTLTTKVNELQNLLDNLQTQYEESGIQNKKYESEIKSIKDAIKAAVYN